MTTNSLPQGQVNQPFLKEKVERIDVQIAQEKIYAFFADIVTKWSPEDVLKEFKRFFLDSIDSAILDSAPGVYLMLFHINNEKDFCYTLKRCFYIIVNYWENNKKNIYIQELVKLLTHHQDNYQSIHIKKTQIFKVWLENFFKSNDFQEIKVFIYRNDDGLQIHWANRYTSYLLIAQSVDPNNSKEQQEVARKVAKQLKDKFKFELAIYVARSQSNASSITRYKNPSLMGDEVLRLIKAIVIKKGVFNYENIANIFLKQTQNQSFKEFKDNLPKYLIFSVQQPKFIETLTQQVSNRLLTWKSEYDQEIINSDLLLKTSNKIIDCLTTEKDCEPSPLFVLLLSQGHPLTLVIVLLKIVLMCQNSRSHLEARIGHLVRYYQNYPEQECKWVINFLEIFKITFAIYAENVEYNLIKVQEDQQGCELQFNPDAYRVFAQLK